MIYLKTYIGFVRLRHKLAFNSLNFKLIFYFQAGRNFLIFEYTVPPIDL